MDRALVPIFVVFIVIGIPVICVTLIVLANTLRGGSGKRSDNTGRKDEEAQVLQELNRGLSRMEERIEALETIIIERDKRERRQRPGGGSQPDRGPKD